MIRLVSFSQWVLDNMRQNAQSVALTRGGVVSEILEQDTT
jgi:hypothetical protein